MKNKFRILLLMLIIISQGCEESVIPTCTIAKLEVFDRNARLIVLTKDTIINVDIPYQGYRLHYTVSESSYPCIGWSRTDEEQTIKIWDSHSECTFVIPAL